jgi:hypothetical protein
MKPKFPLITIFFCAVVLLAPLAAAGETLSSPNYNIENPELDVGGEPSSSTNYTSRDSIGAQNDSSTSSTNYNIFPGFQQHAYPGVPGTPTLTNTGGTLYNSLDFVIDTGGNASDANYAIALSSDDFATTFFVQADDSIGGSTVWQDYAGWGSGTGERITGLSPSTTYKIRVKARFGPNTETAYSQTASATTSAPSMTITFSGVGSGNTVAGQTTTVASTTNAIPFGTLILNTPAVAAHTVTISTNATGGYTTTLQQDGNLRTDTSQQIDPVAAGNASPAAWPGSVSAGEFGYHTTDSSLCTGSTGRFSANDTYAALTTSPAEVACSAGPVTSEATTVVYKLQIGAIQVSGSYQNKLTYISTAQF